MNNQEGDVQFTVYGMQQIKLSDVAENLGMHKQINEEKKTHRSPQKLE